MKIRFPHCFRKLRTKHEGISCCKERISWKPSTFNMGWSKFLWIWNISSLWWCFLKWWPNVFGNYGNMIFVFSWFPKSSFRFPYRTLISLSQWDYWVFGSVRIWKKIFIINYLIPHYWGIDWGIHFNFPLSSFGSRFLDLIHIHELLVRGKLSFRWYQFS